MRKVESPRGGGQFSSCQGGVTPGYLGVKNFPGGVIRRSIFQGGVTPIFKVYRGGVNPDFCDFFQFFGKIFGAREIFLGVGQNCLGVEVPRGGSGCPGVNFLRGGGHPGITFRGGGQHPNFGRQGGVALACPPPCACMSVVNVL